MKQTLDFAKSFWDFIVAVGLIEMLRPYMFHFYILNGYLQWQISTCFTLSSSSFPFSMQVFSSQQASLCSTFSSSGLTPSEDPSPLTNWPVWYRSAVVFDPGREHILAHDHTLQTSHIAFLGRNLKVTVDDSVKAD